MEVGAALAGRIRANEATGRPAQEYGDNGVALPPGMTRRDAQELLALQEQADAEEAA